MTCERELSTFRLVSRTCSQGAFPSRPVRALLAETQGWRLAASIKQSTRCYRIIIKYPTSTCKVSATRVCHYSTQPKCSHALSLATTYPSVSRTLREEVLSPTWRRAFSLARPIEPCQDT